MALNILKYNQTVVCAFLLLLEGKKCKGTVGPKSSGLGARPYRMKGSLTLRWAAEPIMTQQFQMLYRPYLFMKHLDVILQCWYSKSAWVGTNTLVCLPMWVTYSSLHSQYRLGIPFRSERHSTSFLHQSSMHLQFQWLLPHFKSWTEIPGAFVKWSNLRF